MPTSSVGLHIITKNEIHNLPVLFESVKDSVDEIYITDTGSTDGTIEYCEKYGAKVSHFKWIEDFAAARNFNFSQGTTDFQLWLDSDDSLQNPEMFKLWKNEVMPLADYHLATYHYASQNGAPVCSFVRERVLRRDRRFRWNYFVHEGIVPTSEVGPVRCDLATTWAVLHRRSNEDVNADRMRNLALFRGREKTLDARMQYYYGKELFEAGMWDTSSEWLKKAVVHPQLEPHDRLLSYQYMAYGNCSLAQRQLEFAETYKDAKYKESAQKYFQDAISTCLTGIQIDPNRAEFYVTIADSYIKQGEFNRAIPFLSAAAGCSQPANNGQFGPLFSFADQYSYYPRIQLVKCLAHLGQWDRAYKEAKELLERHPTDDAKAVMADIERIQKINAIPTDVEDVGDIVISCPPGAGFFAWDGKTYRESFCGGSETAAIELAENLAKITGRKVTIYNDRKEVLEYEGVTYRPIPELQGYLQKYRPWLHIAWRHPSRLTDAFTILWCHDLITQGAEHSAGYNVMACLTQFHKRYVQARQGIPEGKIWVTRNGLNPEKFKGDEIEKDPFRFVFSSSPDRGLDRAMLVLDRVRVRYPQVQLFIHYGIEHLERYGLGDLQKKLKQMMDERPWVHYIGKTSQADLIKSFKASAYCVQPSDFIETSMISAMERLCCGVYQIIRKVGGCVDTLAMADAEGMAKLVDSDCLTEAQYNIYVDAVLDAMHNEAYKRVKVDPAIYSWETVAKEWVEFVEKSKK